MQQGVPLEYFIFSLVLHLLIHNIRDNCKLILHVWYLDDETVVEDLKDAAKALDVIREMGRSLSLELNINKYEIFWPLWDGSRHHGGLFLSDIGNSVLWIKLLGGPL